MATGKKYYWIKLKSDFLNGEIVDFILSQKNGSDYLAIYLKLCTMTVNNNGELSSKFGEIIVPYDAEKIQKDCKHFSIDTVIVALELFSKLELIYVQDNGILKINNYEDMVGSTTDYAAQKKLQRAKVKQKLNRNEEKQVDFSVDNVHIEYRDKEIRDKEYINNCCFNKNLIDIEQQKNDENQQQNDSENSFNFYANEFGRLLSPSEIEIIKNFKNDHTDEVINHALKIAVEKGKKNMAYVRGILTSWKSANYQTVEDIIDNEKNFKNNANFKPAKTEYKLPEYKSNLPDLTPQELEELKQFMKNKE